MIRRLLRFLRGGVTVEVRSAFPERFLNMCWASDLELWDLKRPSEDVLIVTLRRRDLKRAEALQHKCMCTLTVLDCRGLAASLRPLAPRLALMTAAVLCAVLALASTCFLWRIRVRGCVLTDRRALERELADLGLRRGALLSSIDERAIQLAVMSDREDIRYVTVNLRGNTATVDVIEGSRALPDRAPCDIVSDRDGIVLLADAASGEALVRPGDAVLRGDVLIAGNGGHAEGSVTLRTLRTVRTALPAEIAGTSPTGRKRTRFSLLVFGRVFPAYAIENRPFSCYYKNREVYPRDDGGYYLPVRLIRETWHECVPRPLALSEDRCAALLRQSCLQRLEALTGGGETVSSAFDCVFAEDRIMGVLQAECIEKAGVSMPND